MDMMYVILATLLLVQYLEIVLARYRSRSVCDSEPCQNGGQCIDESVPYGPQKFKCSCQEGYEGLTCQKKIDPCAVEPCDNGGICTPKGEHYHCICMEGYHGRNCETSTKKKKNPCNDKPCGTHGICEVVNEEFICECHPGYHGPRCEIEQHEEIVAHPIHTSAQASKVAWTLSSILIVLLVFLVILCLIFCIMCIHCSRVINRHSKLQSMKDAKRAAGKKPPRALGWIELSNKVCYETCCCCCDSGEIYHESDKERHCNDPDEVTGVIVPVKDYNDMLRQGTQAVDDQALEDLAIRRNLAAKRSCLAARKSSRTPCQLGGANFEYMAEDNEDIGPGCEGAYENDDLLLESCPPLPSQQQSFANNLLIQSRNPSMMAINNADLGRQQASMPLVGGQSLSRMNAQPQNGGGSQSVSRMTVGPQGRRVTLGGQIEGRVTGRGQSLGNLNPSRVESQGVTNQRLSQMFIENQGLEGPSTRQMAAGGQGGERSNHVSLMSTRGQDEGGRRESKTRSDGSGLFESRLLSQTNVGGPRKGGQNLPLQNVGSQPQIAANRLSGYMDIPPPDNIPPVDTTQNNSPQCQQKVNECQSECMVDRTPMTPTPSTLGYYGAQPYQALPQPPMYPCYNYAPPYAVSEGNFVYPASMTNNPQYPIMQSKNNRIPRGSLRGFPISKSQTPQSPTLKVTSSRRPLLSLDRCKGKGNQSLKNVYKCGGKVDSLVFDDLPSDKEEGRGQNEELEDEYHDESDDDYEENVCAVDDDGYASTSRLSESDAGGRCRDPQSLQAYTDQVAKNYRNRTQLPPASPRSSRKLQRRGHISPNSAFSETPNPHYSSEEDEEIYDGQSPVQTPRETLVHRKTQYGSYTIPRTRQQRVRVQSIGTRRGDIMKSKHEPPPPSEDSAKRVKGILKKKSAYACTSNQQISANSSPNNKTPSRRRAQCAANNIDEDEEDVDDEDDEEEQVFDPRRNRTRNVGNNGHGSPREQRHYRSHQKYRRNRYPPSYPPPFYDDVA